MSDLLYLTADIPQHNTGGGRVTLEELTALRSLGCCEVWDGNVLQGGLHPWNNDKIALARAQTLEVAPKLCHVYAGSFSKTLDYLKLRGTKVAYTAVAHCVETSRKAHEELGLSFPHEHLNDPVQFKEYIRGYIEADMVVCPSTVPEKTIRKQGRTGPITVIPHGCDWPEKVELLPKRWTLGYLGSLGCDKSIVTLLKAWKLCNFKDATLLLAGKDTASIFAHRLVNTYGGGVIQCMGWVDNISDFYNRISCYAQTSATEGWGIEVMEAAAFGRPVICSDGAGASDAITSENGFVFHAGNVNELADRIAWYKANQDSALQHGKRGRELAANYTWDKIRQQYVNLWKGML